MFDDSQAGALAQLHHISDVCSRASDNASTFQDIGTVLGLGSDSLDTRTQVEHALVNAGRSGGGSRSRTDRNTRVVCSRRYEVVLA